LEILDIFCDHSRTSRISSLSKSPAIRKPQNEAKDRFIPGLSSNNAKRNRPEWYFQCRK
jgi:hypothetical protein